MWPLWPLGGDFVYIWSLAKHSITNQLHYTHLLSSPYVWIIFLSIAGGLSHSLTSVECSSSPISVPKPLAGLNSSQAQRQQQYKDSLCLYCGEPLTPVIKAWVTVWKADVVSVISEKLVSHPFPLSAGYFTDYCLLRYGDHHHSYIYSSKDSSPRGKTSEIRNHHTHTDTPLDTSSSQSGLRQKKNPNPNPKLLLYLRTLMALKTQPSHQLGGPIHCCMVWLLYLIMYPKAPVATNLHFSGKSL